MITQYVSGRPKNDRHAHLDIPEFGGSADLVKPPGQNVGGRLLCHKVINESTFIVGKSLEPTKLPIPSGGGRESTPCIATGINLEGKPIVAMLTEVLKVDMIGFGDDALIRENHDGDLV